MKKSLGGGFVPKHLEFSSLCFFPFLSANPSHCFLLGSAIRPYGLLLLAMCSYETFLRLAETHGLYKARACNETRVLLLPLMGDEKLCDGLSEARIV